MKMKFEIQWHNPNTHDWEILTGKDNLGEAVDELRKERMSGGELRLIQVLAVE